MAIQYWSHAITTLNEEGAPAKLDLEDFGVRANGVGGPPEIVRVPISASPIFDGKQGKVSKVFLRFRTLGGEANLLTSALLDGDLVVTVFEPEILNSNVFTTVEFKVEDSGIFNTGLAFKLQLFLPAAVRIDVAAVGVEVMYA